MRAILLASATRTSIGGLRDSIPASQVPGRAAAWTWRLMMTLLAPRISRRLRGHFKTTLSALESR